MIPQLVVLSTPTSITILIAAILFGFAQRRASVLSVLILVVFEGAIRKWFLTDRFGGATVYFLKDALLLGVYLRYASKRQTVSLRLPTLPWRGLLILFAEYLAIEILNPGLPSMTLGVVGFKAFLFYAPLLWIVPAAIDSPEKAIKVLRTFAYVSIPVLALGIVQYRSPMDSPLVRYLSWSASEVGQIATIGDRVRVASTFAFVSGYALYLFVLTIVASGTALHDFASKRSSTPVMALIAVGAVVSILITGSRWPLVALAVVVVAIVNSGMISGRLRIRIMGFTVVTVGVVVLASGFSSTVLDRFVTRVTTADSFGGRIEATLAKPITFVPYGGLFGFGVGATHQIARVLVSDHAAYDWLPTDDFEQEPGRVVLELGVVGFVLYYALRLAIVRYVWRLQRRAPPGTRTTIAIVAMVQLAMLTANVAFDAQACLYVWYFAGIARMLDGHRSALVARSYAQLAGARTPFRRVATIGGTS